MNKTLIKSVITVAGLAMGSLSFAAAATAPSTSSGHWYAGIGTNYYAGMTEETKVKSDSKNTYKLDSSNLGYTAFVGNRLTKNFGVEALFNYYGDREYLGKNSSNVKIAKASLDKTYAGFLNGIGYLPLAYGFEVFAKAGVGYYTSQTKLTSYNADGSEIDNSSSKLSTFGMTYGAGIAYTYQQFGARISYTQYKLTNGDSELESTNGSFKNSAEPSYLGLDVLYTFN